MTSELSSFGSHLIAGLSGTTLLPVEIALLKELSPLGIILFSKNIKATEDPSWIESLKELIKSAKEASERENFFVSIDHEGGRVHRFPSCVTRFDAACYWKELSESVAEAMGFELATLGITTNFAPVLDIHSEKDNPVIGPRALSTEPDEVFTRGLAVFRGLEKMGIVSCGKHFPGHGATKQDSHLELPILDVSRETLMTRELVPFKGLSQANIPMVMSAHVLYPILDSQLPASLSPRILKDLLRDVLHFKAAVITDDLEMKALKRYSASEKALCALEAGNDILLEANPSNGLALETSKAMLLAIAQACDRGNLDLEESRRRISVLETYHEELASKRKKSLGKVESIGKKEHLALAAQASKEKDFS